MLPRCYNYLLFRYPFLSLMLFLSIWGKIYFLQHMVNMGKQVVCVYLFDWKPLHLLLWNNNKINRAQPNKADTQHSIVYYTQNLSSTVSAYIIHRWWCFQLFWKHASVLRRLNSTTIPHASADVMCNWKAHRESGLIQNKRIFSQYCSVWRFSINNRTQSHHLFLAGMKEENWCILILFIRYHILFDPACAKVCALTFITSRWFSFFSCTTLYTHFKESTYKSLHSFIAAWIKIKNWLWANI